MKIAGNEFEDVLTAVTIRQGIEETVAMIADNSENIEAFDDPNSIMFGFGPIVQPISNPCFQLLKTFDIVVPEDYDHSNRLKTFEQKHGKEFCYYNPNITDCNFAKATAKLTPGRQLKVKVFQITETVTSEDCLNFLKSQPAILVGA